MKKEWREVTIDSMGQVVTGNTPATTHSEFYGDRYPFITPSDLDFGSRAVQTERFLSERGKEEVASRLLPPGSVCFTSIGATIGKMCMTRRPSVTNQQINSIVVDETQYDTRFVYYLLRNSIEAIKSLAGGAATPIVSKSKFAAARVVVPPLPTQRRIAGVLSAYDDLIENNTRRIQILEEMAQAIYRQWFVEFKYPGYEDLPLVDSGTELGDIPQRWEVYPFSELVEINPKHSLDKKAEKTYVGMNALSTNSMLIDLDLVERKTGNSGAKFQNRDVLFPRITPSVENGKAGFVQFLDEGQVSIGSTEIIVFREKDLNPEYIYFLSRQNNFRGNAIKSMVGASGRQRVQPGCFNTFLVAKPTNALLEKFAQTVSPMFEITHTLAKKNANLRATRDLLLPRLVSGKVDISELEIVGE